MGWSNELLWGLGIVVSKGAKILLSLHTKQWHCPIFRSKEYKEYIFPFSCVFIKESCSFIGLITPQTWTQLYITPSHRECNCLFHEKTKNSLCLHSKNKSCSLQTANTKPKRHPFTFSQPSPKEGGKMSFQPQQQQQPQPLPQPQPQQQQQPVVVYPSTVTGQAPPSHHSNGSFGSVFIVLAVIIVVSAIACFLGRLCNRRYSSQKPKQNHRVRHKESGGGDIEFGFDNKKGPTPKPGKNGGGRGQNVDHIKSAIKPVDREGAHRPDAW